MAGGIPVSVAQVISPNFSNEHKNVPSSRTTGSIRIKFGTGHQGNETLSDCVFHVDPPILKWLGQLIAKSGIFSKLSETAGRNALKMIRGILEHV